MVGLVGDLLVNGVYVDICVFWLKYGWVLDFMINCLGKEVMVLGVVMILC